MASGLSFLLVIIISASQSQQHASAQEAQAGLIDIAIRDSAFRSFPKHRAKTGSLFTVQLPMNMTSVNADVAGYRSGSLRRHGAVVREFKLAPGLILRPPHVKRIIMVRENLGNFSFLYANYRNISGYRLVSPIVGLLVYNASGGLVASTGMKSPSQVEMVATKEPIIVDFSEHVGRSGGLRRTLCASFGMDGSVSLLHQMSSNVCVAWREGHFGLVEVAPPPSGHRSVNAGRWKVYIVIVGGVVFGAVMLGFLCMAFVNVKKKKMRIGEMERRAYEEEALRVSMVGHVRAPTAPAIRTLPAIENEYSPSF